MALRVALDILNQKGTPAFYSDTFANRPAFGFAGRVFISTDTGAIYEDTGTAWTLIADAGAGTTGTLQQVTTNGNTTTQGISITAGGLSANSITNTSLTTGSVAFVGAAGLMTQDNANLFWDDTNNRLGIGTSAPTAKLDIHGAGAMATFNGTSTNNGYIAFQNAGVTKWTMGNQYTGVVNNFQIINRLGNSVFSITGDQQANFEYNVTIKQALNLNNVGDQLRISSGAIDGSIHTNSGDNLMFIGATSTGYGANIDLSTGSIALTDKVTATRFVLSGATSPSGLYYSSNRVTVANYTSAGTVEIEVNGGLSAATFNADQSTTLKGSATALNINAVSSNPYLLLNDTSNTTAGSVTFQANGVQKWNLATQANKDIGLYNNGGTSSFNLYIPYTTGNLLIGTTTDAGYKLYVNGTASFLDKINFSDYGNIQTKVINIPSSVTRTVTLTGTITGSIQIMVAMYGNGSGSQSYAMWFGGGYLNGSSLPYSELARVNGGTTTISAITSNASSSTFTLANIFAFNTVDCTITIISSSAVRTPVTITIT